MPTQPTSLTEQTRIAIYEHFVQHGGPPDPAMLTKQLGIRVPELDSVYAQLAEQHAIVLNEQRQIWMAIPFSAVPTDVQVEAQQMCWWANCAFDGLGIAALLAIDATVHTHCPHSGQEIIVPIRDSNPCETSCVLHMAVPLRQWWQDIGHT